MTGWLPVYLRTHSLGFSLVPLCQGLSWKNGMHLLHVSPSVPCLQLQTGFPSRIVQLNLRWFIWMSQMNESNEWVIPISVTIALTVSANFDIGDGILKSINQCSIVIFLVSSSGRPKRRTDQLDFDCSCCFPVLKRRLFRAPRTVSGLSGRGPGSADDLPG